MNSALFSETFSSIQGEGPYVGTPSFFARMFGCNLKCPGFGQSSGPMIKDPHLEFIHADDIGKVDFLDLPIVPKGCDSYMAWDPKFKDKYTTDLSTDELLNMFIESGLYHLVATGGEPLLKGNHQDFWIEFLTKLDKYAILSAKYLNVTFETNGTKSLSNTFKQMLSSLQNTVVLFSISLKLSNSGEPYSKRINKEVVHSYISLEDDIHQTNICFKFVVGDESQIKEIKDALPKPYFDYNPDRIYLMPEGGTVEEYQKSMRKVADICMKSKHFTFSPRLHLDLYGNKPGT